MLCKEYDRKGSVAKTKTKNNNSLIVSLQGLGAKTN
jgi:hypothetical protein